MLKIGLVGAGHLGKIHLKCIRLVETFELVGFFDADAQTAKTVAKDFDTEAFESYEQLLEAVDVVDIVTPTPFHFELAKKAIQAGKHVFIEKPLTQTTEQGQALLQLAKTFNIKAQVGHVERFNPAILALGDMEIRPKFMEVHRLAMFNPRGTDVSVVLDLMIHDLDIILKWVKAPLLHVHASGVSIVSETSDIVNARLEFENGAVANLTASRISLKNMRKIRVFQPNAYLSLDFLQKQTEIVRLHEPIDNPPDHWMELNTATKQQFIEMAMPETAPNNAIQMELEQFAESILTDKTPTVTLADGVKVLELAYKIMEAVENNQNRCKKYIDYDA